MTALDQRLSSAALRAGFWVMVAALAILRAPGAAAAQPQPVGAPIASRATDASAWPPATVGAISLPPAIERSGAAGGPLGGDAIPVAAAGVLAPTSIAEAAYVPGQVIVALAPGLTAGAIALVNQTFGTTVLASLPLHPTTFLLAAPLGADAGSLASAIGLSPLVEFATTNRLVASAEGAPYRKYAWDSVEGDDYEDQAAADQAGMEPAPGGNPLLANLETAAVATGRHSAAPGAGPGVSGPFAPDAASGTHDLATGAGVIVAVVDTGIDPRHPVLQDRLHSASYDWVALRAGTSDPANGVDDDADGLTDEDVGHGTHVAGVIHLVAPDAQLLSERVLNSDGRGSEFTVAMGMDHAVSKGARVANMSLVFPYRSPVLDLVVADATRRGVLVVSAAGNEGSTDATYPAAHACSVGVSAVDAAGRISSFANRGLWVDIAAPGEDILSAYPAVDGTPGYALWNGTSIAAPFVAGQAALLLELRPRLSPAETSAWIAATARSLANGDEGLARRGLIRIHASLTKLLSGARTRSSDNLLANCDSGLAGWVGGLFDADGERGRAAALDIP